MRREEKFFENFSVVRSSTCCEWRKMLWFALSIRFRCHWSAPSERSKYNFIPEIFLAIFVFISSPCCLLRSSFQLSLDASTCKGATQNCWAERLVCAWMTFDLCHLSCGEFRFHQTESISWNGNSIQILHVRACPCTCLYSECSFFVFFPSLFCAETYWYIDTARAA